MSHSSGGSAARGNSVGSAVEPQFIPLPPLSEQVAICAHLDATLGEVKRIVAGIEAQITTLTAYRKSLIHEYVTGQRRVTAAGDRIPPPCAVHIHQ